MPHFLLIYHFCTLISILPWSALLTMHIFVASQKWKGQHCCCAYMGPVMTIVLSKTPTIALVEIVGWWWNDDDDKVGPFAPWHWIEGKMEVSRRRMADLKQWLDLSLKEVFEWGWKDLNDWIMHTCIGIPLEWLIMWWTVMVG